MSFVKALIYSSIFSISIPLIIAFFQWSKLPARWSSIRWILITSLLGDVIGLISKVFWKNTFFVGNLYLLIQFCLILYILYNYIRYKKVVIFLFGVYMVYYIFNLFYFENILMFLTTANTVGSLVIILLLLYFFYQQLTEPVVIEMQKTPINLIFFAFLLYYGGSLFVFLTSNYFLTFFKGTNFQIWMIHNVCNILKNILVAIALWLHYRSAKLSAST